MKKLTYLLMFSLIGMMGCEKDSEPVKAEVFYTINVKVNDANTNYSFYEPNEKLRTVKGSYSTIQKYAEGQSVQVSAIYTSGTHPINIIVTRNGTEVLNKNGTNDLRVSFTAE